MPAANKTAHPAAAICICNCWSPALPEKLMDLNNSPTTWNVTVIPPIPANIPSGIPIALKTTASKNTPLFNCFLVAPMEDNKPNCFLRSLTEIEKEFPIREIEPNIIMPMRINIRPDNTESILFPVEYPAYNK